MFHKRGDATLSELIGTLRITSTTPEFRHPSAKFVFRALYADSATKGHFSQKDIGQISARELLDDHNNLMDHHQDEYKPSGKTLEELRFIPGDFLCVAVHLPKNVNLGTASSSVLSIKGSASAADTNAKWARGVSQGPPGGLGRGGSHWRARPGVSAPSGRGGGGGGGIGDDDKTWRGRDRDLPPPRARRDSPPRPRPAFPERDRTFERPRARRTPSRSRSRSPRRRSRYD